MPFKHQSNSYRNRRGERYVGYEDCPDRDVAKQTVSDLRGRSIRAFAEHDEAYSRVFIHEADGIKAGLLTEAESFVDQAKRLLDR